MHRRILSLMIVTVLLVCSGAIAAGTRIVKISGEVRVRRGMEETWQPATIGMLLKDVDTILTGSDSWVMLKISNGTVFKLTADAMLDISDLRKISEKELFLYLMSRKVRRIKPRSGKTKLHLGDVSVVHGESKVESAAGSPAEPDLRLWRRETNGARALHHQRFYPNSIIKYYNILEKYGNIPDCGEIYLYLGKSFEALRQHGQAMDAYQKAIIQIQQQHCTGEKGTHWLNQAQQAMERLQPKK